MSKLTKVNSIFINAKEWTDRKYGVSYFSFQIEIEYTEKHLVDSTIVISYQTGYGDHYVHEAKKILIEKNIIPKDTFCSLRLTCEEMNINYYEKKNENCLKRDMKSWGEE